MNDHQRREAIERQRRYEEERAKNEEFERQKILKDTQENERRLNPAKAMADQENVRTVEETLPDGTKVIRRIITRKSSQVIY